MYVDHTSYISLLTFIVCARQAGITTESRIELFVHNAYFIFQVVQVFLITTVASAASGVLQNIIKNPMLARDLLSANLPKASNFYISYFILQGLAMSATRIVHLGGIFRHVLMANVGGPRLIARRYHNLRKIHWGSVYPVFTNMGVIGKFSSTPHSTANNYSHLVRFHRPNRFGSFSHGILLHLPQLSLQYSVHLRL